MSHIEAGLPDVATTRESLTRRRVGLRIMMLAATTFFVVAGCSSEPETVPQTQAPSPAAPPHVAFYATGEGTASGTVTLRSETGGTIQKDVALPMVDEATGQQGIASDGFKRGAAVYMSLQNRSLSGKVTCRIEVDGKVVDEATSSGGGAIAACRGTVP